MTNGNDTIHAVVKPDFVYGDGSYEETSVQGGLTKREYFAAMCQINEHEDDFGTGIVKTIMGVADIPANTLDAIAFWDSYYAKRKVMKADALINELNK